MPDAPEVPDDEPEDEHDDSASSDRRHVPEIARPKKRWFDRGLVWLALVVVLALVALAVSFLAADSDTLAADVAAPDDISAYCYAAKNLGEAPAIAIDVGEAATALRTRVALLDALAQEAPSAMAVRINRFKDSLQPVIDLIESPAGQGQDAIQAVTDALDEQAASVADDGREISDYTVRICGFRPEDLAVPADDEEPADQAPAPSDPAVFCDAAKEFAEVPAPAAPTNGSTDSYQAYSDKLATLVPSAPPSIARRIQNIVDSLEIVMDAVRANASQGPAAYDAIATAMDEQESQIGADAAQFQAYVQRICGFDMAELHGQAQPDSSTSTEDPLVTTTVDAPG